MKKLVITILSIIVIIVAVIFIAIGLNKKVDEPVILDFVYKELKGFDNDGVLLLEINDSNDTLVEQIIVTYLGEDISRVEYIIHETDDDTLEADKKALEEKEPSEINVTEDKVIDAIYRMESQNLNSTFESYTKKNISNTIDILRTNYPEYNISYKYTY